MHDDKPSSLSRDAVLIFADLLGRDLARRGWSRNLAAALKLPEFDADALGGADMHLFTPGGRCSKREGITIHAQRGRGFGQRLSSAIDDLAASGYQRVVIVGRDCPQLTGEDVGEAFARLDDRRLVIGPDHRGGCWLIGLHVQDRALLAQVRWQHDEDAAALLELFGCQNVHRLEVKFDLDRDEDVRLLALACRAWRGLLELLAVAFSSVDRPRLLSCSWLSMLSRLQIPPPAA